MAHRNQSDATRTHESNLNKSDWHIPLLIAVFFAVALSIQASVAAAESTSSPLAFDVSLASDYVFRGVSQTMSKPALQAGVDFEHDTGIYAYAWASNVDFVHPADPDDGARWELDLSVGYWAELNSALALDLSRVEYLFPGTNPGINLNYGEWIASLYVNERYRATAGYSESVFGESAPGSYYELAAEFDMPLDTLLTLEAGHYDLERAYGYRYSYGSAAVSRNAEVIGWSLAWHWTGSSAENIFYESTVGSRFVASVHLSF